MKKLLLSVMALLSMTISANAGTFIGSEDNSTAWWSAFSDYYTLTGDGSVTIKFTNYSDKAQNWDNWLCVCTNDNDRGATGYLEYFVMRADNYGWGATWNTAANPEIGTLTSNYNWDTFKDDMDGSTVLLTLSREGNTVKMQADITTAGDEAKSYYETWEQTVTDLPETIRFFLTTEKGHLVIEDAADDTTKPTYTAYGTLSKIDWEGWESYSPLISDLSNLQVEVYENDSIIVRDWYGKGKNSAGYTYDLVCVITDGHISSYYTSVGGVAYPYYGTYVYTGSADSDPIVYMTPYTTGYEAFTQYESDAETKSGELFIYGTAYVGQSSTSGYYHLVWSPTPTSGINNTTFVMKENTNAPMFNLAGQRVNASAKGLVIKNGKKMILK